MLALSQAQSRAKRPRDDASASESEGPATKRRPVPAPRHSILEPAEHRLSSSTITSEAPEPGNDLVMSLMAQISSLQQANQAQADRMAQEHYADHEMFRQSLAAVNAQMDNIVHPRGNTDKSINVPQPRASTPTPVLASRRFSSGLPPAPTPREADRQSTSPIHAPNNIFPNGQPAIPDVNPQQLQRKGEPVQALRNNVTSADVADRIMKDVGILEDSELERRAKNGTGKQNSRKHKLAKWPSDYVLRLDDEEPAYDTLSAPEVVAGYLSLTEETLPAIPENRTALGHMHYLRGLMEDCPELGWEAIRIAHKMVLTAIELKRLTWADTEAVQLTFKNRITMGAQEISG